MERKANLEVDQDTERWVPSYEYRKGHHHHPPLHAPTPRSSYIIQSKLSLSLSLSVLLCLLLVDLHSLRILSYQLHLIYCRRSRFAHSAAPLKHSFLRRSPLYSIGDCIPCSSAKRLDPKQISRGN